MIEYEKSAMIEAEGKYTFRQSTQISMQTGLIGHLRADMDTDGNGFFSSWFDFREELKTDEFKAEFDEVINSLREEGDILHNRRALAKYCYCTPQSRMQEEPGYYGVRVDTEKYAYLLRLNPDRGEYNLYCYCYRRDWLDQHLKDAEKGIRFIDSHYKELFRIPDGGKVKIHYSWNEEQIRTCRYIDDYYVLALAAIARELNIRKMTCGKIRIAAGLPLTWVSGQRDEFRDYLMQNKAVDFSFRNVSYHVEIVGVDVFPQGFAAVADRLSDFRGVNMICDIGNGTMNIMFINDKKPVSGNMFTEKYGTHQCLLAVRENVMRAHHTTVDEAIINRVFRFGTADIKEEYLKTITDTATDYVEGIFQRLREHEYNPELMRLYVLGGGSCLIRNFGVYDASRVTINDDICATAKGYEYLAQLSFRRGTPQ